MNPYTLPPRCPDWLHTSVLSDVEKLVWLVIRGVQGKNPTAWAGRQHYADLVGKDPAQVSRATKQLVKAGWLEVVGKRGRDTEYRCHAPGISNDAQSSGSVTESHSHSDGESFETRSQMTESHRPMTVSHSENDGESFTPTTPYKEESVQESVQESLPPVSPTVDLTPETAGDTPDNSATIQEIVEDLNAVCDTSYRASAKATRSLIRARLSDGYSVDDFRTVHRKKAREWLPDPDMRQYLRPATLYRPSNFESYLHAPAAQPRNRGFNASPNQTFQRSTGAALAALGSGS